MKRLEVIGATFGRLRVLSEAQRSVGSPGVRRLNCVCACGAIVDVSLMDLRSGDSKSCGCLRTEVVSASKKKHGDKDSTEYTAWTSMRDRCNRPSNKSYPSYGGRGIVVDPAWDDYTVFLSDMGRKPEPSYSLDRVDNSKGYSKENCLWASRTEQANNTRRNRKIPFGGESISMVQLTRKLSIPKSTIYNRLRLGWTMDEAISTPVRKIGQA